MRGSSAYLAVRKMRSGAVVGAMNMHSCVGLGFSSDVVGRSTETQSGVTIETLVLVEEVILCDLTGTEVVWWREQRY